MRIRSESLSSDPPGPRPAAEAHRVVATRLVPARLAAGLLVAGLLALPACRSSVQGAPGRPPHAPKPEPPPERTFHEGTSRMQESARALVAEVPSASLERRFEIARRITALGEPGVHLLVEALRNPDPAIRGFAAWTLGFAGDRRALPALRDATADPVKLVSLEAAAARVRLGDDGGLVRLVEGLEDPDPRIRGRCIDALDGRIHRTFQYAPDDPPSERAAAVERWRVFLRQRALIP